MPFRSQQDNMNNMTAQQNPSIKQQASDWYAKVASSDCSPSDTIAFEQWIAEDQEHELAYSQCLLAIEMTASLASDKDIQQQLQTLDSPAKQTPSTPDQSANDSWYQKPRKMLQIAAALVLAVGITLTLEHSGVENYSTGVGEQRMVRLDDGSSILLNTDTKLAVKYRRDKRSIELIHGEAYFTVAKDRSRPFEVHAGNSLARALGTQFSVALLSSELQNSQSVSVEVTEGLVEVEAETQQKSSDIIAKLGVGDAIVFNNSTLAQTPTVSTANIDRIEAWQQRKIYFKEDTLRQAIDEYNRYSDVKFHIIDTELEQEKISGLFNVGDIDAFIYSLEQLLNIEIVKNGDRIFLINSAKS